MYRNIFRSFISRYSPLSIGILILITNNPGVVVSSSSSTSSPSTTTPPPLGLHYKNNNPVPSISSLAPPAYAENPLVAFPVVQNFWGAVDLRHDMVSLGAMAMTPYNGNFQNSTFIIDGNEAITASTRWNICEGIREGSAGTIGITNAVRMPFESYAVLQQWSITVTEPINNDDDDNGNGNNHSITANFDGPFFNLCDIPNGGTGPCGWGTNFPIDRSDYTASIIPLPLNNSNIVLQVMITVQKLTGVTGASVVWWDTTLPNALSVQIIPSNSTFNLTASFIANVSSTVTLKQVMVAANSTTAALAALTVYVSSSLAFSTAWTNACSLWENRWQQAFQRPTRDGGNGTHFSGSLPVLESSTHPDIVQLYYWSALAMVSLERTNYPSGPRTFVISQGPSNSLDGGNGMGGSGQFVWDESFVATALSLLDPEHAQAMLTFIIQSSNTNPPPSAGMNILVPQYWDAYPPYGTSPPALGSYRFDFYSAYLFLMTYATINNDTAWLQQEFPLSLQPGTSITGVEYLLQLAQSWLGFNASVQSPWLADYGGDKRDFLEVVPLYIDVVPALQFGNAGMALATARLYEQLFGTSSPSVTALIDTLRYNATQIFDAAITYLWQDNDNGAWRCAYPNGSSYPVRSVTDYVYIAQAIGLVGRNTSSSFTFPANIASKSVNFFWNELLSPDTAWVRALSLDDPLCANVMIENATIEDLLVCRADWGCFGSYGGIPGFAVESSVHLLGSFDDMIASLQQLSGATAAPPSQGIALGTPTYFANHFGRGPLNVPVPPFAPSFPEFFDEPGWELFWPSTLRYLQNAEASFVDAIIRSLFGWRPEWIIGESINVAPNDAITASLYLPNVSRGGFQGTLSWLRTPYGYINITANDNGLTWVWAN